MDPGRILDLTRALVALPSVDREQAVQALIAERLGDCGFEVHLQEVEPGRPNLVATRGDGGPILCSHADVHPPHGHPDPWTLRDADGTLIGRGACDAKGQIAALLAAVHDAPDEPAVVVITCDEEGGGLGSERLVLPDTVDRDRGALVLEPTGLRPCVAQSGAVELRLEASTDGGHAFSTDALSAFDVLRGAVDALGDLAVLREPHPLLSSPSARVGLLDAGEHAWRSPAHARATVVVDVVPGVTGARAAEEIADVLGSLARVWAGLAARLSHEIIDLSEAYELPASGRSLLDRLQRAVGEEAEPAGMPSWTDASNLWEHHGVPSVIFGAGDLATAHSDEERVRLDDLVRLAEILAAFLRF